MRKWGYEWETWPVTVWWHFPSSARPLKDINTPNTPTVAGPPFSWLDLQLTRNMENNNPRKILGTSHEVPWWSRSPSVGAYISFMLSFCSSGLLLTTPVPFRQSSLYPGLFRCVVSVGKLKNTSWTFFSMTMTGHRATQTRLSLAPQIMSWHRKACRHTSKGTTPTAAFPLRIWPFSSGLS